MAEPIASRHASSERLECHVPSGMGISRYLLTKLGSADHRGKDEEHPVRAGAGAIARPCEIARIREAFFLQSLEAMVGMASVSSAEHAMIALPMEDRLTTLEIRYTHLERHVEELSQLIFDQQKTIDRLTREIANLRTRTTGVDGGPTNEPPPHY